MIATVLGESIIQIQKKVAEKVGFSEIKSKNGVSKFILAKTDFDWSYKSLCENNKQISEQRLKYLKKKINYASKILWFVQNEFEACYDDCDLLDEVVEEVRKYTWKLEDIWYTYKKLKETV